jgi:hypothetical protein
MPCIFRERGAGMPSSDGGDGRWLCLSRSRLTFNLIVDRPTRIDLGQSGCTFEGGLEGEWPGAKVNIGWPDELSFVDVWIFLIR